MPSLKVIRHEFSPAGNEARTALTLTGQVAKLAPQPAASTPGHERHISTGWHVRCTTPCKVRESLPFSRLGRTCANYHTNGNSRPITELNRMDAREGCRGLGKMVIHP